MAGLFSGIQKAAGGLFSGDFTSKAARAQAIMEGDYGSAAGITADMQRMALKQREAQAEAKQLKMIHDLIDNDPGLPGPQSKGYAKANPKAYIENYMTRFQVRQFGPGGGSIYTPGQGGQADWQMAPSRHEYQGSVYDVGGGKAGEQFKTTPQHEGTQWVTPQPGTEAFPVNSFTGRPGAGGQAPIRVSTEAEVMALPPGATFVGPDGVTRVKPGGATASPSPTFPY